MIHASRPWIPTQPAGGLGSQQKYVLIMACTNRQEVYFSDSVVLNKNFHLGAIR
jgi:hypothetical protein